MAEQNVCQRLSSRMGQHSSAFPLLRKCLATTAGTSRACSSCTSAAVHEGGTDMVELACKALEPQCLDQVLAADQRCTTDQATCLVLPLRQARPLLHCGHERWCMSRRGQGWR